MPRYYRVLLQLSVVESLGAITIAIATFVNLMPLWMTLPDAADLDDYGRYVTTGFGLWGTAWAIPCLVMLGTSDDAARRRFGRLAGVFYLAWWVLFWEQVVTGAWQPYVVAIYVPLRAYQALGHTVYGWSAPRPRP